MSSRLPVAATVGVIALLLTSCTGEQQQTVGVDSLTIATLGPVTPDQQAFLDRLTELSEGSISLDMQENWQPSGGSGSAEEALAQAVHDGDVDIAWVTLRSLRAIGLTSADSLEAPLLIQTHAQQREVATGQAGEIIMRSVKKLGVEALVMIPGPEQYPVASGAPLLDIGDWVGKTVEYAPSENPDSLAAAGISAFGATPGTGGTTPVADVVSGTVAVATASPVDLVAGGATGDGPYLTANLPLWPRMGMVIINSDVLDRFSTRQHGFLEGAIERAQDLDMADPDLVTPVAEACDAGIRFGVASADQLAAYHTAVQPIYDTLSADKQEAALFKAIQDAVARSIGTGSFTVPKGCKWKAPEA